MYDNFTRPLIKKLLTGDTKVRFQSINEVLKFDYFLSNNQIFELTGLPTMWQYELDIKQVPKSHVSCVMVIDVVDINKLHDELGEDEAHKV